MLQEFKNITCLLGNPVFYSLRFCLISWRLFDGQNVIIGILDPCHAKIYHMKCMWVSDLHFMVQWFCLISSRLLDGLMLYWRYWFSVTQTLNWNYICRSVTYISWSIEFALYLEDYLMDKCHNWNIGSMWCKDLPHKMYMIYVYVTYISWSSDFVLYLGDYLID